MYEEERKEVEVINISSNVAIVREVFFSEDGFPYHEEHTLQVDTGPSVVVELKFSDKEFSLEQLEQAVRRWKEVDESFEVED